jgi:hypothetical protein
VSEGAGELHKTFRWPLFFRSLVGLILAPTVGGAAGMVGAELVSLAAQPSAFGGTDNPFVALILGAYGGGILGAPGAIIFGWPLHLLLLKQRWTHLAVYVSLGAMLGVVSSLLVASLLGQALVQVLFSQLVLVLAFSGAVGGLVFWQIRRPERDTTRLDASAKPPDLSVP